MLNLELYLISLRYQDVTKVSTMECNNKRNKNNKGINQMITWLCQNDKDTIKSATSWEAEEGKAGNNMNGWHNSSYVAHGSSDKEFEN